MSKFFDYFQIAALVLFLLLFAGKTLYLRFIRNINPITVVVEKKGRRRAMDIFFIIGVGIRDMKTGIKKIYLFI